MATGIATATEAPLNMMSPTSDPVTWYAVTQVYPVLCRVSGWTRNRRDAAALVEWMYLQHENKPDPICGPRQFRVAAMAFQPGVTPEVVGALPLDAEAPYVVIGGQ